MDTILDIVSSTLVNSEANRKRPKVCLTWAQSLDGRLSMTSDAPTIISGSQSMQMTHALRALHQTILIGIGTLMADNPRLTCRMDPATRDIVDRISRASEADQDGHSTMTHTAYDPIPVVLDSNLRTPPDARCLHARPSCESLHPFVFHCASNSRSDKINSLPQLVRQVQVPLAKSSKSSKHGLDLSAILHELQHRGIESVMVEGGASVISSFLHTNLWDIVVVTISPKLFRSGVTLQAMEPKSGPSLTQFRNPKWVQLGNDIVFIGFP